MGEIKKVPEIRFGGFTDEWQTTEVGFFYNFKNGLNKGKEFFGYGKPIVNFTDVFHNRELYASELKGKVDVTTDEIKNYGVRKGDLFFTRTSETIDEIGYPSVILDEPKDAVFSGFVLRARAIDEDPLDDLFKKYVFNTEVFRTEMIKKSSMTTRALTSGTAIKKMLFTFPIDKKEQRKLGEQLTKIEKLLKNHNTQLKKLTNLKKAMLIKMFPQDGASVPEIRFKGFDGEWERIKLDDIGFSTSGTSIESEFNSKGKYKVISIGSYSENSTYTDQGLRVNLNQTTEKRILKKNDLTMVLNDKTMSGNILGRVLLIEESDAYVYNQRTQRIEPNQNKFNAEFLYQLFNAPTKREKIIKICQGNTQIYVNWSVVKELKYLIPEINEQQKIGNYFKNLDNLIDHHRNQLKKLNQIKNACLSKLFVSQD
ncbi:restriction endonuclease subunit S [Nonlabens sp.]